MEEYFYTTLEETGKYIIRQNGVSFSRLQNDFGFNFFDIYDILSKLEKYHVLGTETSYGTRDVLMTVREFEIVAERCFTHDEKNTKYRITSPLTTNTIKQSIPATTEQSIANQEEINFNDVIVSFFNTYTISSVQPNITSYEFARYYIICKNKYDTYSIDDVNAIPIPEYNIGFSNKPYYNIEYLLKKRAIQEHKKKNYSLSYALMYKTIEFMKLSKFQYLKRDYMQFIMWLYKDGAIEEASILEKKLRQELPDVFERKILNNFFFAIGECKRSNCDYIECIGSNYTCGECAKYINRVYCISGKDKRFPKLPDFVYQYGGFHPNCKESFFKYEYGELRNRNHQFVNAIEYSNRPFIDDRTPSEIQKYNENQQYHTSYDTYIDNQKEFFILRAKLPNILPKTYATFKKYKETNSPKYARILEIAKQQNISSFLFN